MREGVTVEIADDLEGFSLVRDEWDRLVRAMPRPSPFLLHRWLEEWWGCFGGPEGASLRVCIARRDGCVVGALPLMIERSRGLRVLRFMGGPEGVQLGDALLAEGEPRSTARRLLDAATRPGYDFADLFGLPSSSVVEQAGQGRLTMIERLESPVMDISAGWMPTYRKKTNSKKRAFHLRRRRQLAGLGKVDTTVARSAGELERALEAAFRLHALRWAGRPERSGFGTEAGKRFHRAAYRALAEIDVPRIVLLELDGTAIAFCAYLALAGRMYSHHLAFDPAYFRWSPGLVNMLDTFEVASAEGIATVEFLGGGERYKLELADRMAPVYEGVGLARTVTGRAGARARRSAIAVRMRAKRSPRAQTFYYETLAPLWRTSARFRGSS